MRAFGRSVLPVIGLFMGLAGGAVFLVAMAVAVSAGRVQGLSHLGRVLLVGGAVTAVIGIVLVRRGTRTPSDLPGSEYGPADGDVYAIGRRSLLAMNVWAPLLALVCLIAGPLFLVGGLMGLVEGPGFGDRVGGLFIAGLGVGGIGVALWMGQASIQAFRLRHHQDPYFRVDGQAIECARGRFPWRDVERVVEVIDTSGEGSERTVVARSFICVLREGVTPQRVERSYLDGMDTQLIGAASLTPYGLELRVEHCRNEAYQALATYRHTPVKVEREELAKAEVVDGTTKADHR
jgi:hypothetical protein